MRGDLNASHILSTKKNWIFVEKMREAFAMQKLLTFCQQKYWYI